MSDDQLDALQYSIKYGVSVMGLPYLKNVVVDGETMPLNIQDVKKALIFIMSSDKPERVAFMCKTIHDIPYVRRSLIQLLGSPNKQLETAMYYGNKTISLITASSGADKVRGYSKVYYIAYKDDADWDELCAQYNKPKNVPYMLMPWMSLIDIYNLLIADGVPHGKALYWMYEDGLINGEGM